MGGYNTVDVSDPSSLTLLSTADATNVAGRSIALNGSGLAVVAGSPGGVFGANVIDVMNANDPTNTGNFITRITLPAAPRNVTLANGLAFVASGTAGLQVVNYIGFDNKGQAPTVSITIDGIDADTTKPGIQVL